MTIFMRPPKSPCGCGLGLAAPRDRTRDSTSPWGAGLVGLEDARDSKRGRSRGRRIVNTGWLVDWLAD